jgi:hypothetical protein
MAARRRGARRATVPGGACVIGLVGWAEVGAPAHLTGALIFIAAAVLITPVLMIIAVFWGPVFFASLWPRRWRAWYRHWRQDNHFRYWFGDHFLLPGKTRTQQRSSRIYQWMRNVTLAADQYQCIYGGNGCLIGTGKLAPQIDHGMPWSRGGLTAVGWNLFTLCAKHNRIKSDYYVIRGRAYYNPFEGSSNEKIAADILYVERWQRFSLFRIWRLARALGWLF